MELKPINNSNYFNQDNSVQKQKEDAAAQKSVIVDKLELSSKAKELHKAEGKNLLRIQDKVNSGFYNSDEVINYVASAVMKDITL